MSEELPIPMCVCGHHFDDHSQSGECQVKECLCAAIEEDDAHAHDPTT